MKVRFLSPANNELDEAVKYYDHQLPGLGFRFFQEKCYILISTGYYASNRSMLAKSLLEDNFGPYDALL